MENEKIKVIHYVIEINMPKTKLGKWSLWCSGVFILFFVALQLLRASGQEGGDTPFDNLYISIPVALFFLSSILAFVFGLISIIKNKERSWFVYIVTFIGLLIVGFLINELFGPDH